MSSDESEDALAIIDRLEAENAKLRKVAEAAMRFRKEEGFEYICQPGRLCPADELEAALKDAGIE